MSLERTTLVLVAVLLGTARFFSATPAAAQAILTNGTVTLGVSAYGQLGVPGPASPIVGTQRVGLRFNANGWEALANGRPCEGWGAGVASTGATGGANACFGDPSVHGNLRLQSFAGTPDSATSVVTLRDALGRDTLLVRHDWMPSFWPNLYQANVHIENLTGAPLGRGGDDIRYRRVMDWDVEATMGSEHVTIGGMAPSLKPPFVRFTSDDGFEIPDPLHFGDVSHIYPPGAPVDVYADTQAEFGVTSPVPCGFTTDFTNCGRFVDPVTGAPVVADHGALFDFAFPAFTMAGEAHDFAIFYGAAATRADAELALFQVGAEVYSLVNCNPAEPGGTGSPLCDLTTGAPVTFIFGAAGLGGNPAFGDITVYAFRDLNGNGVFDYVDANDSGLCETGEALDEPVNGVALTLQGTDLHGTVVARTGVSDRGCGVFDFAALPAGTYTVTVADPAGGYKLAGVAIDGAPAASGNSVTVSIGGTVTYVEIDFRYVTGSIAGTVFSDANGNAALDTGDTGLAGVTVSLDGVDAGGAAVHRTTTTASGGTYAFGMVLGGGYTVSVANVSAGGLPADTPAAVAVALGAGENRTRVDFGYCARSATALVSSANPSAFGTTLTLTASVTACGSAATAGAVTFTDGTTVLGSASLDAAARAVGSTSTLTTGSHSISASYLSGGALPGSGASLVQVVTPRTTATAVTSSVNPSSFGQVLTFTATVSSALGAVTTGTVTFSDSGAPLGGPLAVDASGRATLGSLQLGGGGHSITADYSGATNFAPSSGSLGQTVSPAATTTALSSSLNPSTEGLPVAFTASVTSALGAVAEGTVTFTDGATSLGTLSLDAAGRALLTTSALAVGGHTVTATYTGTVNFAGSRGGVQESVLVDPPAEACVAFDFREITYFRHRTVLTSSDASIRSRHGVTGAFNPALWPYDPRGGGDRTKSRGTLFRIYGFAGGSVGQRVANADNAAIAYTIRADAQIPGMNFIDLGGPARVLICPSLR